MIDTRGHAYTVRVRRTGEATQISSGDMGLEIAEKLHMTPGARTAGSAGGA